MQCLLVDLEGMYRPQSDVATHCNDVGGLSELSVSVAESRLMLQFFPDCFVVLYIESSEFENVDLQSINHPSDTLYQDLRPDKPSDVVDVDAGEVVDIEVREVDVGNSDVSQASELE